MIAFDDITLGKTGINISPMGLGTMQWGDITLATKSDSPVDDRIQQIFQVTLGAGINFFDTAEIYGGGKSEIHLGKCIKELPNKLVVGTKFMPYPWRMSRGELRSALLKSLQRMGLKSVDLYQMHWPFPIVAIKAWMDAMSDVMADGLIRAIGVSNYSVAQTRTAFEALEKYHIPLASNQVKYSLLDRHPEKSGLTDLCKSLNISIIAYSPLEKGILTGKYTPNHLPRGLLSWRYNKSYLNQIEPLMDAIHEIGKAHGGITPAKISLNWLICKGAIPIPGARNLQQAQENTGGLGWKLSVDEVARLDRISEEVTT